MGIEVKRKKDESFESFLRRFNKRVQQSKILLVAKQKRFREKPKSRNLRRESALHRLRMREYKEYLRKVGKLKEEKYYS